MPSSNKTSYLELNRWSGSDKPKMTDFNNDNQRIDNGVSAINTALSAHLAASSLHLSTSDKNKIAAILTLETRTYTGNGAASRKITLGYKPRYGIIYAVGKPMFEINAFDVTLKQYTAFFTDAGAPEAVTVESDGISFTYNPQNRPDGNGLRLNENGVQFVLVAAR